MVSPSDYLKLFQVSEKRFILGIYQKGITVYRQQIRALNLLYSLVENNTINKDSTISIIGCGIGGMTLASAALKMGMIVNVLEKKPIPAHMQHGCDIRKIHPNIYEWPSDKASLPYTELPLLNWKCDTAANVTRQIEDNYNHITKSHKEKYNPYFNVEKITVEEKRDCVEIHWSLDEKMVRDSDVDKDGIITSDILIYAVGYGIEIGVDSEHKTPSYWRNDEIAQLSLNTPPVEKYIISGTGDGAFNDLFRLKIVDFDPEKIIESFKKEDNYEYFASTLKHIRTKFESNSHEPEDWLYKEFDKIESKTRKLFSKIITHRVNPKNEVILNGQEDDGHKILSLNRTSMLNAFIAYTLIKSGNYKYVGGEIKINDNGCSINGKQYQDYRVIIRRGTNKEKVLYDVNLSRDEIKYLKDAQELNFALNKSVRLWPPGWWSALFASAKQNKDNNNPTVLPNIEFFPPDTHSICTTFISTLSDVLDYYHRKLKHQRNYRVTIHRVLQINNSLHFQQLTPYFTKNAPNSNKPQEYKGAGRVFSVNGGTVGLSIRTGKPILLYKKNDDDWNNLITLFKLDHIGANKLSKNTESLLTIPILGKTTDNKFATNLIVYIDSSELDFFIHNSEIIQLILSAINGFINSIEALIDLGQISMGELGFTPIEIDGNDKLFREVASNSCFQEIDNVSLIELPKLKKFISFDIILQHEYNYFH